MIVMDNKGDLFDERRKKQRRKSEANSSIKREKRVSRTERRKKDINKRGR